ncbi:MAG TPA: hypothetical protein VNI02_14940 [Blastocatellia bacterium]|nr:hypothetical protein [Blastocatellia bacterium]
MKRAFILIVAYVILLSLPAASQTRKRAAPRRSVNASKPAAPKTTAETQAGRDRLAGQIKTLSQFLYLLGGIAKGIEATDLAARNREASSASVEQNERNKTRVRESIRNVRDGLDKLERDFRGDAALRTYYQYLAGVAAIAETAENQAAASRFDEAGRSLLKAVNQLADALAAMR